MTITQPRTPVSIHTAATGDFRFRKWFAHPLLREPPTLWLRMIEHGVRIFYDVSRRWRGAVKGYDIREAEY